MKSYLNQRGQSLIEYLLLVAIMGIASIGVIRMLNHTVNVKLTQVTKALNGERGDAVRAEPVSSEHYKVRHLGDFFESASE